jgi:lipoprotein-anchoring transpeptidase ErfK/SrfK
MSNKAKKSIEKFLLLVIIALVVFGVILVIQNEYAVSSADIFLEKNQDINSEEAVVVDLPMAPWSENYANEVRVVPDIAVNFQWQGKKKLVIIPKKFWMPETEYKIILPQGRTIVLSKIAGSELNFSTVKYPRVMNISPNDGAQDSIVDAESPITVNFDKSTSGFFVNFVLDPQSTVVYQNNPEKTEFKILPKENVQDAQRYEIKIYAKYIKADDANYFQIFESSFKTFVPANIVWDKDFNIRLAQARRFTRPQIAAGKYIDIHLENQVMTTFQDGKLLDAYMISSGKVSMPTIKGTFKIENKTPRAWSKEFGLYMPYWNALVPSGKFGIHELPEWPGGYKEGAAHLGTPVSHGCVRLGVGPAKIVYDWAPIGTPVVIH